MLKGFIWQIAWIGRKTEEGNGEVSGRGREVKLGTGFMRQVAWNEEKKILRGKGDVDRKRVRSQLAENFHLASRMDWK